MTIYCLLELVRFKKIQALDYWFYIKAVLVIVGTAAALPTMLAGKIIAEQFYGPVLDIHSRFAIFTTIVFGIISLSYLIAWIEKDFYSYLRNRNFCLKLIKTNDVLHQSGTMVVLALFGLALISITGALGGIMAFGPEVDPFTKVINELFFGK